MVKMNYIVKQTTFWDIVKILFDYVFIKNQEIQIAIKPILKNENTQIISTDKPTPEEKKEIEEYLKSKEKLIVLDEIEI
jgi:hypothetical protein